ncbi:anthranilate phosphoribosyltransferase [Lewinellaceae bacterium SD302]|nr:anthranilate phosphoribosyltransferase [Lewinellaceae bacterium SD302]
MKATIESLYRREALSREDARQTLLRIGRGEINPAQIAAFISIFNMRPITMDELQGFRDAMLELAVPLDLEGRETIDVVGTGGDGKNTFNISTLSCVVIAGAGYQVSKHGSYGVSSAVGSSDVLIALGYEFTNDGDKLRRQLDEAGICFLHAPLFHPAMKEVVPIRRELKMKTFFNWLGPLLNPAKPKFSVMGTYGSEISRLYDYVMQEETGREYAIVHSRDGYDEVSLTGGGTQVRSREGQQLLYPQHFGLPQLMPAGLHGGETKDEGAKIFLDILDNNCSVAQKAVVCANSALAIRLMGPDKSLEECAAEARESIESSKAREVLNKLLR